MRRLLTIFLLCFISSASSANDTVDLVKAAQISESVLLGMKLSMEKGYKEGSVPRQHFKCIDDTDPSYFDEVLTKILDKYLTKPQIAEALTFYTSEAGRKYTRTGFIQIRQSVLNEKWDYPLFSQNELKELENFTKSSAGKVLIRGKLLSTKKVQKEVDVVLKKLYEECKP